MKTFFVWITIQCVFARVLFALILANPKGESYMIYATTICIAEAVASAIVIYPLILAQASHIYKPDPEPVNQSRNSAYIRG